MFSVSPPNGSESQRQIYLSLYVYVKWTERVNRDGRQLVVTWCCRWLIHHNIKHNFLLMEPAHLLLTEIYCNRGEGSSPGSSLLRWLGWG